MQARRTPSTAKNTTLNRTSIRLVFGICFLLLSSVLGQESDEWDTSCQRNSDCVLKNRDNGFSCCFAGVCDSIDYSTPAWQAVNSDWWEAGNEACPTDCEQPYDLNFHF